MAETTTPERELTRAAVLRSIALHGPVSRTAIAGDLEVSPATVTALTRDLLADGLIVAAGKDAPPSRGRPAELLQVAPSTATLLGAKVSESFVTGVTGDLLGATTGEFQAAYDGRADDPIAGLVAVLTPEVEAAGDALLGIGLGVPGVVDVATGHVTAPTLGWVDLPVGPALAERFGCPVVVDNDVHTLAIAEGLDGRARDVDDVLTVTLGRGVGLAITVGGRLHRGARGGAGEFGHTRVVDDGRRCACGRTGCLEAIVGEAGLLASAVAAGALDEGADVTDLQAAAAAGDEVVGTVLTGAGVILGRAVGDLVNLLAPSLVLISGEGTTLWAHLEDGFHAGLLERVLPTHDDVEVAVDPWDDLQWARGAMALLLGPVYRPEAFSRPAESAVRRRLHDGRR